MAEQQGQNTPSQMTTGAEDDEALLAAFGDEGEGEPAPDEPQPASGFMSADQVQQLLDNQRTMMMETLTAANRPQQPQPAQPTQQTQPDARQIMPTAQEVREAFEQGDPDRFIDVYNRGLQAVYTAAEERIADLERSGTQRIQQLAQDSVQGLVPDEYRDDVKKIMDDFNLPPDMRTNRKLLEVLTNAARGQNLDQEVSRAVEARVRQATQRRTAEPTSNRTARGQEADEPIFGMPALQALRNAGRSPDQHAQQLGYANWDEYERATAEKYETWQERSVPAWRQRLNERRQNRGRRTA